MAVLPIPAKSNSRCETLRLLLRNLGSLFAGLRGSNGNGLFAALYPSSPGPLSLTGVSRVFATHGGGDPLSRRLTNDS
jgi:hypothetical protein